MPFSDTILKAAGHCVYALQFANELEERGGNFPPGSELYGAVDPLGDDPVIKPLLAKIERKLGASVEKIFQAGGIPQDEETLADALGDLLLSVDGQGVGIHDDYGDQWEAGCKALGIKSETPYIEMDAYRELAAELLDLSGYPEDTPEDTPEAADTVRPIIEIAYDWHGGQDDPVYAFASTRMIQHENHRAGTLARLERSLTYANEKQPADVAELERLIATVRQAKIGQKFFYV